MVPNPEFQGAWKANKIKNPAYKGKWTAPEIDNPEYKPNPLLYNFKDLKFVGFELWQVRACGFDNFCWSACACAHMYSVDVCAVFDF